ncbi:MAG: phospholipid/cholesterol/gamma-HCH transport system permease protein [Deferribacteres bacterium]|jgi:phospholipid/cholesterol/gamma-HCH transport system permease protein|nr:transporter, permease [Deferribacteraceae bacterium]MDK2792789.1 phospholipid/cholesterol/gamma-HCH transport system permease protein [Deferribacteres bacterium]
MFVNVCIKAGKFFVESSKTIVEFIGFSSFLIRNILKMNMFNPTVKLVFFRQIYFTGVQILSVFSIISLFMGFVFVGFLTQFLIKLNAYQEIGQVLSVLIIRELAPLISVIMLALRSSTAVGAEIAVMNITGETRTLKMYKVDLTDYLYVPRVMAGLISMVCLSTFFTFFSLAGGYFLLSIQTGADFAYITNIILDYVNLTDIFCFLYKSTFFGFLLMAIPIYTSKSVKNANTEIPVALLKGMMRLFYGIIFVEITGFLI